MIKTAWKWISHILVGLVIAAAVLAVFEVAVARNYIVDPIATGSMTPGFPVGGVSISEKVNVSSLKVGDVVAVKRPDTGEGYTHRIISLSRHDGHTWIATKGDANAKPDPWGTFGLASDTTYRVIAAVPLVGFLAQSWLKIALLVLCGGLAIMWLIQEIRKVVTKRPVTSMPDETPTEVIESVSIQ
jgi:signal peptidase I